MLQMSLSGHFVNTRTELLWRESCSFGDRVYPNGEASLMSRVVLSCFTLLLYSLFVIWYGDDDDGGDVPRVQLPLEVTLDASGSSDSEGIVSVEWDCEGDGVFEAQGDWTVATARTHVCTYDEDGIYEATVQATNSLVGWLFFGAGAVTG